MQIVIFKNKDGTFSILVPSQEILQIVTIQQIAEKDVPAGCPYWIIDSSELPQDVPVEAIYIDENEFSPHGYGGESNEFPPEVIEKYLKMKGGIE
jgi:hypothetical protein